MVCYLFYCMAAAVSAEEAGNILILNSNMSTEKYALAQAEFKSRMEKRSNLTEINLGEKEIDEAGVERIIRKKNPELIYCIGSKAYMMSNKLAKEKKTVFSSAINWRRLPMGRSTYGVSNELPAGMQLMTYRYFFPGLKKIGVLYNQDYNAEWLKNAEKDAEDVGIEIIAKSVKNSSRLDSALEELLPKVDALWLISDPVVLSGQEPALNILQKSDSMKKPVFAYNEIFSSYGALLVIDADIPTIVEQASVMALDLLSNKKIPERVPSPAGSHITLNMKKVEEYGIELNREAIGAVNRIIK